MIALATAFGLVFIAEAGDKSMLLALTLGTRFPRWWVLIAIAIEAAILFALAVALGGAVDAVLPRSALAALSGVLFIAFGLWTLRAGDDGPVLASQAGQSALVTIAGLTLAMGLSELGDKTQIAVLSLSGTHAADRFSIWLGATVGMVAADAIVLLAGERISRLLPPRTLARAAAAVFIAFGVATLVFAAV